MYHEAPAPTTLEPILGTPRVYGIKLNPMMGPLAYLLNLVAASHLMPVSGKSFYSADMKSGTGENRLKTWGLKLAPFALSIGPSNYDSRDAIILDFAVPGNPALQRYSIDELREVRPGVFMGPMLWCTKKATRVFGWFAIDTTEHEAVVYDPYRDRLRDAANN
jgi:hypothetical protein